METTYKKKKPEDYLMAEMVRVFAPATAANLVCGYDVLGLALDAPGDEVLIRRVGSPGVQLTSISGDDGRLPMDPEKNTVSACVKLVLEHLGLEELGVEIELEKKMPIGSGLGSSAASTVAGLFAINELLGRPLSKSELLPFALKGEELACGHGHADNVAPALLGGITLIRSYDPLEVIQLPVPEQLYCSVVFPHVDVPTRAARQMIRSQVLLKDAVTQWGNIAGLVSGLFTADYALIGRCMKDVLIEPTRSILIPEFENMRKVALDQGALGFGISGSGPSVFAFSTDMEKAERITSALQAHLDSTEIGSNGYSSPVNTQGPRVLEVKNNH